jgi:hypothetical protein
VVHIGCMSCPFCFLVYFRSALDANGGHEATNAGSMFFTNRVSLFLGHETVGGTLILINNVASCY